MQQLVLAIEPDLRQAAIVKRIVREKGLADVAVVDSRDAAMEAMRTAVPDVLLLSALLSPRDEDELVAHLRTRHDAEHLQTHTIPQLSSSVGGEDEKPSRGLLSAFRRRKGSGGGPTAGCDPDLFAEEIRTYLKRASEKKRETRDGSPLLTRVARPAQSESAAPAAEARSAESAAAPSSWESPFEWRPSRSTTRAPEPAVAAAAAAATAVEERPAFEPPPLEAPVVPPAFEPAAETAFAEPVVIEPVVAAEALVVEPPVTEPAIFESAVLEPPAPVADIPVIAIAPRPSARYPLTMRTLKGWWFVEGKEDTAKTPDSDLRAMLSSLSVPLKIAAVAYADGCRVRRVRLIEA
jgi:CheY-like chemotaxis protein